MFQRGRFSPTRGLVQAAFAACLAWAVIPAEEAPPFLQEMTFALMIALAVAALAMRMVAVADKRSS